MVSYSTTDIVNALVSKGVLTEEEGALLTKGRTDEAAGQAKALKKAGKVQVSDAIDNATIYGDIRVRHESRKGEGYAVSTSATAKEKVEKDRYKITLGVKTESGNAYSDLAIAMGKRGRSDNADFGSAADGYGSKDTLFVKRAMFGYKATDWLAVEAGRMDNPLYTTSMVWDADIQLQGFAEKAKFKVGETNVFLTAFQSTYVGPHVNFDTDAAGIGTTQAGIFAFQGGAQLPINDKTSAKAALTYTTYSHEKAWGTFTPGLNNTKFGIGFPATSAAASTWGFNDLNTIEIPAEINYMAAEHVGVRLYGDFVYNTTGSDRFNAAVANAGANLAATQAAGNDDTAWSVGFVVGSAKDLKAFEGNKMAKGDWNAKVWYQDVGVYSVDQNLVDTDIFDARVNMKGTTLKAQYNLESNLALNLTVAHGTRKNSGIATAATAGQDLGLNLNSMDLIQADVTYKF